MDNIIANF